MHTTFCGENCWNGHLEELRDGSLIRIKCVLVETGFKFASASYYINKLKHWFMMWASIGLYPKVHCIFHSIKPSVQLLESMVIWLGWVKRLAIRAWLICT